MTREYARNLVELMPILKAYAEGKAIQIFYDGKWNDYIRHPREFDFPPKNYRVKPEPRTFWINNYPDGYSQVHLSKQLADLADISAAHSRIECIQLKEVI